MPPRRIKCNRCNQEFPIMEAVCPHCAEPRYPNVELARLTEEESALDQRYREAVREAKNRSCEDRLGEFEKAAEKSGAVIACGEEEMARIASADKEIYGTFYNQLGATRMPEGSEWDLWRDAAESALYGRQKHEIRFAALSLDGRGLWKNWGEYSLTLRPEMIARRTSVFEENNVLFMRRHKILVSEVHALPKGFRAVWDRRGKLCVAKLGKKIRTDTKAVDFAGILLEQGKSREYDSFVEAHVWGPLTRRTLERVIFVKTKKRKARRALSRKIEHYLKDAGIPLETR